MSINATAEGIGTVTLRGVGDNLRLDVSEVQMMQGSVGTSYYASGSSSPANIGEV